MSGLCCFVRMCRRRWVYWREGEGGNEYLRIHRPRDFRRLFRLLQIYRRLNVGCTRFVSICHHITIFERRKKLKSKSEFWLVTFL